MIVASSCSSSDAGQLDGVYSGGCVQVTTPEDHHTSTPGHELQVCKSLLSFRC